MKVALGTIEVSDEARKAIRRLNGGKGDATRGEVKEYLLSQIDETIIPNIGNDDTPASSSSEEDENEEGVADEERLEAAKEEQAANHVEGAPHGTAPEPVSAENLPEVPGPGTAGGYTGTGTGGGTTPSTGDLGSAGTPGGTS